MTSSMNRKGFEFSFGWMFAIIVGAAVIFLAIYAAVHFATTEQQLNNAVTGQSLAAILSPVETGTETGKTITISISELTRIYFSCNSAGVFGAQEISSSVSSGVGNKWEKPTTVAKFQNKYVFAKQTLEGKNFYVLSEAFNYPFKVADIITVFSEQDKYCFINAPNEVIDPLNKTVIPSLQFVRSATTCALNSTKVCFTSAGCNINVDLVSKTVKKSGVTMYYGGTDTEFETDSLLYGAIFADPSVYECQVKRLAERIGVLTDVYQKKETLISRGSCGSASSNLGSQLLMLKNDASLVSSSGSQRLGQLAASAQEVNNQNDIQICKLF